MHAAAHAPKNVLNLPLWSKIAGRAGIHHIYFALAVFDLAAVGTGLYLIHNLNAEFEKVVAANAVWNRRLSEIDTIRELGDRVATIGYSVFESKNAPRTIQAFDHHVKSTYATLRG